MTPDPVTELPVGYRPRAGVFDELVDGDEVRPHWSHVARTIAELGPPGLVARSSEAARLLDDDGVTYNVTSGERSVARPWVLDPVPVVVAADEWAALEAGMSQRAALLDAVLDDLYGERRLLAEGLVPPEVVYADPGFIRPADHIRVPGRHQLFHAAFDLARATDGSWVVLGDRAQAPSGMGYALENRLVTSRVLPDLYREAEVVRLAPFFRELRAALQRVAPSSADIPRTVVLTPGPWSETAYEHGALASYLGYPLVQGSDLRVRDGRVWVRTLGRLEPVHVIVRRVDPPWCDPLELRPDSTLGAPGLLEAARVGNVSVVNGFGSGVLENPAMGAFLPALCRELLGEELRLSNAATWWCGEATGLKRVLDGLEDLVLKSVSDRGRTTIVGQGLSRREQAELRVRIKAHPHLWVGQEVLELGTVPTLVDAELVPRRSVLRGFVVARDEGYAVMPGGLTRVAGAAYDPIISNQTGAWSKDTWVLAREPERLTGFWLQPEERLRAVEPVSSMSQRAAENLFWLSRYAERAEDVVRLMRVASDRITEFAPGTNPAGNACVAVLLGALTRATGTFPGFVGEDAEQRIARPQQEFRSLLADVDRPGTVAHAVHHMLAAAAQVRDQLSNDTWLVVGHLERDLAAADRPLPVASTAGALGRVMNALLALSGLSAESMVRDDGWQFMEVGRRLERALQLCALLDATLTERHDDATDSLLIESVLTAAESIVTYRRRYRSIAQVETMLDLLVLDASNPRSLAYQVDRLVAAIAAVPAPEVGDGSGLQAVLEELATVVTLADTNELARAHHADPAPDDRPPPLGAFLRNVSGLLRDLGDRLDALHFSHQLPQRIVAPSQGPGWLSDDPGGRQL